MVTCCVPSCCTSSRKCDPAVSFHEFPTEPDIVAKWIRNINTVVKNGGTWYPRDQDKPFICSKHFLPTDFKTETEVPTLKPRSVPTLFANILGFSSSCMNPPVKRQMYTHTPLIVKINKKSEGGDVSAEPSRNRRAEASPAEDFDRGSENTPDAAQLRSPLMRPGNVSAARSPIRLSSVALGHSSVVKPSSLGQSLLKRGTETSDRSRLLALSNKKQSDLELIEIGPNTFLKINPKVIKVAKKVTPSGNSVLQFIMNKAMPMKSTPEIITIDDSEQGDPRAPEPGNGKQSETPQRSVGSSGKNATSSNKCLDNVIGHLVDSHFGKELTMGGSDNPDVEPTEIVIGSDTEDKSSNSDIAESDFIQRAPILLTTGVPVGRCLTTGQRLMAKLKQKNRELKAARKKLSRLQARLESVENKCIVQERELSYAKVKKMKSIRKSAMKGDPAAVYILEQIKAFDGNPVMRWSDSTLRQCSIWCRKAPYAYEYFKKADLFKLPCLSTVKRFMKKCPPEQLQVTHSAQGSRELDDGSSSDFNFDSSDDDENAEQDKENVAESNGTSTETRDAGATEQNGATIFQASPRASAAATPESTSSAPKSSGMNQNDQNDSAITSTTSDIVNDDSSSNGLTVQTTEEHANEAQETSQTSGLSIQEVVLPQGVLPQGIVQCLNSKLGSGQSQYIFIPALNDQTIMSDHQYSVLQSSNGPLIIQNVQNSQLQQEPLILIAHSAEDTSAKSN